MCNDAPFGNLTSACQISCSPPPLASHLRAEGLVEGDGRLEVLGDDVDEIEDRLGIGHASSLLASSRTLPLGSESASCRMRARASGERQISAVGLHAAQPSACTAFRLTRGTGSSSSGSDQVDPALVGHVVEQLHAPPPHHRVRIGEPSCERVDRRVVDVHGAQLGGREPSDERPDRGVAIALRGELLHELVARSLVGQHTLILTRA